MSVEWDDLTKLDRAAHGVTDVHDEINTAAGKVTGDSSAAAAALQGGWSLAGAIQNITTSWQQELRRFADQVGAFGPRLAQTATDYRTAEGNAHDAVTAVWAIDPMPHLDEA